VVACIGACGRKSATPSRKVKGKHIRAPPAGGFLICSPLIFYKSPILRKATVDTIWARLPRTLRQHPPMYPLVNPGIAFGLNGYHPQQGEAAIKGFVEGTATLIRDTSGSADNREERVWAALVMFGAFGTEISFLLSDVQESIGARTERAFEHLQRLIVVDEELRAKWQAAFKAGEIACEKLGGVQLFMHGIWAFKVNAEGERTDLVYQEPMLDFERVEKSAEGLVLTEWKRALPSDDPARCFEEARQQAARYAKGALGGLELASYRYAVVVSEDHVAMPPEAREGNLLYRYVNIAVQPQPPSRHRSRTAPKKKELPCWRSPGTTSLL
jgi:hypothetical protein